MATAGIASAQSKSALSWVRETGAEPCIGTVELGRRVERLVGPMLVAASEGQVSVEGRIARAAPGFVAEITVADASGAILGTRRLERTVEDCRALDDELAFVIAVAIDPNAALAELPADLAQEDDPAGVLLAELDAQPPRPALDPAFAPHRSAVARAERGLGARPGEGRAAAFGWRVALEPALGLGNLPAASAGTSLALGIAFGDLAFWLRGSGFWPQERVALGAARVGITSFGAALAVCPLALRTGPWGAWLCAGAGVDALLAEPVGFTGTSRQRWLFGPDFELRAGTELGAAVWLGASAQVVSRWPRQNVGYEVAGEPKTAFQTPAASGRLAAVLELRFGS